MTDFREVLEISRDKDEKNFLRYSWCRTKYDLAVSEKEEDFVEIDWDVNTPIGEITTMIENFADSTAAARAWIKRLLQAGDERVKCVVEC